MRKLILYIIICFASTLPSLSQDFSWGIKAGVNSSSFVGKDKELNSSSKAGYVGGIFGSIRVSNNIFVSTEFLYSEQGGYVSYKHDSRKLSINQLSMPIFVGFSPTYDRNQVMLNLGIQLEKYLGAKITYGYQKISASRAGYRVSDLGVSIPIVLTYFATPNFCLDLRYNIGITKAFSALDMSNSALALSVGWRFFSR